MTVVQNQSAFRGRKPSNATYIGRGTIWGNPFKIGVHGDREQVIELYRKHLWNMLRRGDITPHNLRLLGKSEFLICHCAPLPCHGDVLLRAIAWANEQT